VIGSNCLDERSSISGIGPITIDPSVQNGGAGRALMQAVIDRSDERGFPGVRLVQAAYHSRSLSLYSKLGFVLREPLARMQGPPIEMPTPGYVIRQGTMADAAECNALCMRVHGHDRAGELEDALTQENVTVAESHGRIVAYTSGFHYFGYSVAENNRDLMALLSNARSFEESFQVPARNHELFNWCLNHGLRVLRLNTLMRRGLYNEPQGAWLPSILF